MGLFSRPKTADDLSPDLRDALCPGLTAQDLGDKESGKAIDAVAKAEQKIRAALQGEQLRMVIPHYRGYFDGVVVLTDRSVINLNREASVARMPLSRIAQIDTPTVDSRGWADVLVVGDEAIDYYEFKAVMSQAGQRFWSDAFKIHVANPKIARSVYAALEALRGQTTP